MMFGAALIFTGVHGSLFLPVPLVGVVLMVWGVVHLSISEFRFRKARLQKIRMTLDDEGLLVNGKPWVQWKHVLKVEAREDLVYIKVNRDAWLETGTKPERLLQDYGVSVSLTGGIPPARLGRVQSAALLYRKGYSPDLDLYEEIVKKVPGLTKSHVV